MKLIYIRYKLCSFVEKNLNQPGKGDVNFELLSELEVFFTDLPFLNSLAMSPETVLPVSLQTLPVGELGV